MTSPRMVNGRPRRHDSRRQRSVAYNLWGLVQIIGHVVSPWRRRWRLRWGARPHDSADFVNDLRVEAADRSRSRRWGSVHAVSIGAPAGDVWPWIAQIGQGRGGFYSFELLENVVGCRITNTDRILPEHQHLCVGDEIRLHATGPGLRVAEVVPGRALVLQGLPVEDTPSGTEALWGFDLVDAGPHRCRLVERRATVHGTTLRDRIFFSPLLVEPIGFVMSREMLLGIKERAERSLPRDRHRRSASSAA